MQVQIQFITYGACSAIGGFSPGDLARVPADMAAHLVDVARCAKYVTQSASRETPAETPKRTRKPTKPVQD